MIWQAQLTEDELAGVAPVTTKVTLLFVQVAKTSVTCSLLPFGTLKPLAGWTVTLLGLAE